MGGNRDNFSGINGNWNYNLRFRKAGNGNEVMGMGTRKSFPHISSVVSFYSRFHEFL